MLAPAAASMQSRIAMYNDNALKIGLFGANCSSGRSATTVPERWSANWEDCLALAKLRRRGGARFHAADRALEGLRRRDRFPRRYAGDHHLGGRAVVRDQADDGVRHRARAAVSPADRGERIRHRRSHRARPGRRQHRVRLERRRVRHVRRAAARARHALRLRPGMGRRGQGGLDARRYVRFRRARVASWTCRKRARAWPKAVRRRRGR